MTAGMGRTALVTNCVCRPRAAISGSKASSSRKRTSGSPPISETWMGLWRSIKVEDAVDQVVALQVADLPKRDASPEVFSAVGVTPWAPQRAFAGQFNRQIRAITLQYPSPSGEDPLHLHLHVSRKCGAANLAGWSTKDESRQFPGHQRPGVATGVGRGARPAGFTGKGARGAMRIALTIEMTIEMRIVDVGCT